MQIAGIGLLWNEQHEMQSDLFGSVDIKSSFLDVRWVTDSDTRCGPEQLHL